MSEVEGLTRARPLKIFAPLQFFRMMRMVSTAGDVVMLTERGVFLMDGWVIHSMLSNLFSVIATKYWLAASLLLP